MTEKERKSKAEYRAKNKGKIKAYMAKWHAKNPEKRKTDRATWKKENPERAKAHLAKWRANNREKSKRYTDDWRANNPDKIKAYQAEWRSKNQERIKIYYHKRRARKATCEGKLSMDLPERLFVLQRGRCAICKVSTKRTGYHLDHIIPLARGGKNIDNNIQLTCPKCNKKKGKKDPIQFMQELGFLL